MDGLPLFLVIAAVLVLVPVGIIQGQKTSKAWASAAQRLGLHFSPGSFMTPRRISGRTRRGFSIEVTTVTRSSGKSSQTDTRIRVGRPRFLGLGLRLSAEGFFSGVTKLLGAQDIIVGDAAFDKSVVVKGGRFAGLMSRWMSP